MNRLASALIAAAALSACRQPPPAPAPEIRTITRPPVSWQGSGNRTLDFVSESGRFRLAWETRGERPRGAGTFRLTVHSGVSGRPLREIVDQRGEARGEAMFEDDPRPYHLMIESANVEWSVTAEEFVTVATRPPVDPQP